MKYFYNNLKNRIAFLVTLFFIFGFVTIINAIEPDNTWLVDISDHVGLDAATGSRIWVADVNNDNYPDLLWGEGGTLKNRLHIFLNVPNPNTSSEIKRVFVDFTESSGINVNRVASKTGRIVDIATVVDVNNDGNPDIVTSIYYHRMEYIADTLDHGDRSEVYLGDGAGHFTLLPDNGLYQLGLLNTTGLGFLDYDLDGNIDLFLGQWFFDYANDVKQRSFLVKGNGDGSFTKVNDQAINSVAEPFYGTNITDWNNDGWQDIIMSPYCRSAGNLYKNNGNGTFTDVATQVGYSAQTMNGDNGQHLCQWAANPSDFDNDGDMDLLQVEVHGGYHTNEGRTHISVNQGPENNYQYNWEIDRLRREAPAESHLGDQGGTWFDMDADGWLDAVICQMAYPAANTKGQERLYLLRQNDTNYFDDISKKLGFFYTAKEGHTASPADYDLDGDQDLFFSRQHRDTLIKDTIINGEAKKDTSIKNYMRIHLLRNDIGNTKNWVSVKLDAPEGCNKNALGSRITVFSDGLAQVRELQAGVGHFATQQPYIQNISLGNRNRIDSIKVRWQMKDFPITTIYNPAINVIHIINKDGLNGIVNPYSEGKPIIAIEEPKLDFDTVNVGESKELTLTVKNIGDAPLVVSSYNINDNSSNSYSIDNDQVPNFTLQPEEKKTITVKFEPKDRYQYNSIAVFNSNAINTEEKGFDLYGYGYAPKPMIQLSENKVVFGPKWIDSTDTQTVNIKNVGELSLQFYDITIAYSNASDNVFKVETISLPTSLNPNEGDEISLSFTPLEVKNYEANLIIRTNAHNYPSDTVKLYGICDGPLPNIELSSSLLSFGSVEVGESKEKSFKISKSGTGILKVSNIYPEEDTDSVFSFPDLNLPILVYSDEEVTVNVKFQPKEDKKYSTKLIVESNSYEDKVRTVTLAATGVITSVDDYVTPNDIFVSVFPNPANDLVKLMCSTNSGDVNDIEFKIYNLAGIMVKEIGQYQLSGNDFVTEINIANLSSGQYYIVADSRKRTMWLPLLISR